MINCNRNQIEFKKSSNRCFGKIQKKFKTYVSGKKDDFYVVYNGKGGYVNNPPNSGLRERILQEINCTNSKTGTLNLINRNAPYYSADNWKVSFFDFDDKEN